MPPSLMTGTHFEDVEQLTASLQVAEGQLRANSELTSREYCKAVPSISLLRQTGQAAGKMTKRKLIRADFLKRRALILPTGRRTTMKNAKGCEAQHGADSSRATRCRLG